MARDKKRDDGPAGAPAWMVTYGDLMSLLLTFFILLLSFSTITEEEAFKEAIKSFKGSLGFMPKELTMVQINPLPKKITRQNKTVEELARKLRRRLQVLGQEEKIKVEYDAEGGLKINLPSQILFDSSRADLKAEAYPVLNGLAELLGELPDAFFEVRGHTDNRPMRGTGRFRDNHDLSYSRADRVARYLVEVAGGPNRPRLSLEQFEVIASGSGRPASPNTTEEGRQANRRVEIHVKGLLTDETIEKIETRMEGLTNPS